MNFAAIGLPDSMSGLLAWKAGFSAASALPARLMAASNENAFLCIMEVSKAALTARGLVPRLAGSE